MKIDSILSDIHIFNEVKSGYTLPDIPSKGKKFTTSNSYDKNYKDRIKPLPYKEKLDSTIKEIILAISTSNIEKQVQFGKHKLNPPSANNYAFNVTGDYRLIVSIQESSFTLIDIGTHSQIRNYY